MFEVYDKADKEKALNGLTNREVNLGGYDVIATTFYPRELDGKPCHVIVFVATKCNEYYLGKSDINTMAMQIVNAEGKSGPNSDYVTNMADYIRNNIPEDNCQHLFRLDRRVRELRDQNVCLTVVIGDSELYDNDESTLD
jgi:cation transport regulator ChaC